VGREPLTDYRRKRDFARTPEPDISATEETPACRFVVHEHHARRLQ
jgi:hypothetical protein